jgi:amino acid adenylation domain-containing protein
MLSAAERHQLLVSWNETAAAYPRERTVVDLFEEQASRRPGSVAVMFEEQQLTYRELNARANQLGRRLRELGVGPEGRVGLCVERSLEMIVGVLGILKAGAAYVPLDPDLPRERLGFMLDDAHVSVLVTQPHLLAQLPLGAAQAGPRIVCLDETHEVLAAYPADDPGRLSGPENLAYVIYTSGSTGRPKGVGVAHRAIVRLARENVYARLTADETILQAAPLAFDASTFEIWGSLLNGGRLALLPAQTVTPEAIGHAIRRHGVDTLFLTTALFHLIAKERPQELAGLRQLLTGGESTSPEHIEAFRRALPACKVVEVYGPTEATTFSSYYPVERDERGPAAMPIGWPIANTRLYVLDDRLQPVPVGVTGELYVGGDGLARGYLDRPALTAERFIPDPFGPETGARLYRTGDRVRYRTDGAVEFLGRLDHQVKLRGFRVELGEIEATLAQHEAIREVVVVAREEQAGDKRLVAYYVAAGEVAASELREFLRQRLPEYMVPSAFVPLAAMPLSPNGKVDRKALPAPEGCRAALGVEYVAARTPTEEVLAGIWAQLLGVEQVGIHDDFFDLGGHSLLATQLVSRARAALKVELPLRDLFEVRTVERLATRIDGLKAGGGLAAEPDAITRLPREANRVRPAAASRQGNGSAD